MIIIWNQTFNKTNQELIVKIKLKNGFIQSSFWSHSNVYEECTFRRGATEKGPTKLAMKRKPIIHPREGFFKTMAAVFRFHCNLLTHSKEVTSEISCSFTEDKGIRTFNTISRKGLRKKKKMHNLCKLS